VFTPVDTDRLKKTRLNLWHGMSRDVDRRTFVKAAGVAGVTGLAGCAGSGGSGGGGSGPGMLVVIGYPESGIQLFRDFYSTGSSDIDVVVPDGLRARPRRPAVTARRAVERPRHCRLCPPARPPPVLNPGRPTAGDDETDGREAGPERVPGVRRRAPARPDTRPGVRPRPGGAGGDPGPRCSRGPTDTTRRWLPRLPQSRRVAEGRAGRVDGPPLPVAALRAGRPRRPDCRGRERGTRTA